MPGKRNRAAEAQAKGKKLCMFEISQEFDDLIEQVRDSLAIEMGSCTRVQALERMGRVGAQNILASAARKKSQKKSSSGLDTV